MKVLLEDGCNPNIVDNSGETLLIDAIKRDKLQSIKLLLANDCKASIKNKQGVSPIGQAIMSMNIAALELILDSFKKKDDSSNDEESAVFHELQIYDKSISHKVLTPIHYLCKLIRLQGLQP
mgnify:CR=1 FL=1